jgi:tubulin-like protein CetZ
MIAFLGLGAAGGNIVDEAVKQGFPGIAINYSQKDLDSLEFVEERLKMIGSEGVGKNREEAIRLMEKNWESAISFVKERFSSPAIEVIFVSFSTGGGSGSGMAPILLELLMSEMEEKTFVAAPILPDLSEVIINQMNCIQASEELSILNICVLPIDNEQVRIQRPHAGKNTVYQKANETFIDEIKALVEYTNKNSKNGVLDRRDLRTIFSTKGIATISELDISVIKQGQKDLTEKGIAKMIQESWDNSIFAPIQYNKIVRAGVIFDGQEALMPFIDFQRIFNGFKSGMPLDLFEGYYGEKTGKVYSILSGLAWYSDRLEKVEKIIQDKQNATEEMMESESVYQSKVNEFTSKIRQKETKKKSITDILSRYRK